MDEAVICIDSFHYLARAYIYTDLLNFIPFQNDAMNRCSISADSQIDNSVSDDSTDEEILDVKKNGYHDAENEVDQETDDDQDRVLSGKLSETSGYGGSDLYDYKVVSWSHLCIHLSNTLVVTHTLTCEMQP